MDDVQFESLASLIEREGPLPLDRALALMKEAALSLAEAHAAGIIHCDLQPATLLVTGDGRVLLAESALARRRGEAHQPDTPETERIVSPLYYPPEAAHVRRLDERSDLFLLGATFYHAMAGQPPFDGPDPEARALQYIRKDAPSLDKRVPATPVLVNCLVQKLLRRNPDERYQSAEELLAVVERTERMLSKRQPPRRTPPVTAAGPEAEPDKASKTQRLRAVRAAAEPAAQEAAADTPAGAAAEKPLWQTKPFIYTAAAGSFLIVVIVLLLFSGGERRPASARPSIEVPIISSEVTPAPKASTASPTTATKPKAEVAKPTPKATTAVRVVVPKLQTSFAPPPPRKKWAAIEGTTKLEKSEDFEKRAVDIFSAEDYIIAWEYAGPYSDGNKDGLALFDVAFPPEKELSGSLPAGDAPKWARMPTGTDRSRPWLIEFDKTPGIQGSNRAIYLRTKVQSPKRQEVQLWVGSDDSVKVWLNGALAHQNRVARATQPDSDRVRVTLKEGWNDLLVKVSNGGGNWSLCLRFRGPDGERLDGIRARPGG